MKYLKLFLLIANLALAASQLGLAHFRATDGDEVARLEVQARDLLLANRQLEFQVNQLTSLERIQESAAALGLVHTPTSTFPPAPVAKLP